MQSVNPVVAAFFYDGIPDKAALNSLRVLNFMAETPEHGDRLATIVSGLKFQVRPDEFFALVKEEISRLENSSYASLIERPLGGKNLNLIKKYPLLWPFHALYWAYGFKDKTDDEIRTVYLSMIGDIALKFVEFYHKMKNKEELTGESCHPFSFYEFIAAGKTRATEILERFASEKSDYLNSLYMKKGEDLDLLFYEIQNTNRWESESLNVVKVGNKNMMKYNNPDENLEFQIYSSRMLKEGSVDDFEDAYHKTLQLYRLEGVSYNNKYQSRRRVGVQRHAKATISYIEEDPDAEILPLMKPLSRNMENDERNEFESLSRRKRRAVSEAKPKRRPTAPKNNNFAQHVKNRAVSAKLTKNALMLDSDYDTPPLEHLKSFFETLLSEKDSDKLLASLFVLQVILGCHFNDLLALLKDDTKSSGLYHLNKKDGSITATLEPSLFAQYRDDILDRSDGKLSFEIPNLMSMLMTSTMRLLGGDERDDEGLFIDYKQFIRAKVKSFSPHISIKPTKTYRILRNYASKNGSALLSTFMATGTYTQGEKAKLSYASARAKSAVHSELITNLWIELGLDSFARKVIGLSGDTFTTHSHPIPKKSYAGSSNCVPPKHSKAFFSAILENAAMYEPDSDEAFNLSSIGMRYAVSLGLGTRGFHNSANFESCSYQERMLTINEKAATIASGMRLIPICETINTLLHTYEEEYLKPLSLTPAVWLRRDGKHMLFKPKIAYQLLQDMSDLKNRTILEQYVLNVPLNTGRHCFTRKAVEEGIPLAIISAFLGHYSAGTEQFGIYSTLDVEAYAHTIRNITENIVLEHGIKDRLW